RRIQHGRIHRLRAGEDPASTRERSPVKPSLPYVSQREVLAKQRQLLSRQRVQHSYDERAGPHAASMHARCNDWNRSSPCASWSGGARNEIRIKRSHSSPYIEPGKNRMPWSTMPRLQNSNEEIPRSPTSAQK